MQLLDKQNALNLEIIKNLKFFTISLQIHMKCLRFTMRKHVFVGQYIYLAIKILALRCVPFKTWTENAF